MSFLELRRITKRFKKETVLSDVSFALEPGETLAIFGASGAGKTVLLRTVAGILKAEAGAILLNDERIDSLQPEERNFGVAFQNFALYPHFSAFDNIASPLRAKGMDDAAIKARVEEVAELLKIGHVLSHRPRELSNGQKQRCALARAVAPSPPLLMLDDPLRNVDAKLRYEMRLELPRVFKAAGVTVIYVTQDYKEAMALGDRIAVLTGGTIAQIGTPEDIYLRPASREVAKLFGDPTINLIEAEPAAGQLELFGGAVRIATDRSEPFVIGIRPEHIEVGMDIHPGAFPIELDAVTPLNVRAVLLLKTKDGRELLASCSEDRARQFGRGHTQIWASLSMPDLLYFEPATGARIG